MRVLKYRRAAELLLAAALSININTAMAAEAGTKSYDPALEISFPMPAVDLDPYFNWAEEGKKPPVRDQKSSRSCWALSCVSALEAILLPKEYSFSAEDMILGNGYSVSESEGGDYKMIMSYLSGWKGPVDEKDNTVPVHVQQILDLAGMDHDRICRMIKAYGPVQSSLAMDTERVYGEEYHYYNSQAFAYYDPMVEKLSHDILVLGWDDDYPKENFRIMPRRNGAWICQNSWGPDFGEDGIFYVSYEDANLFRKGALAYGQIQDTEHLAHIRENDSLGWLGRMGYGNSYCFFASVFEAEGEELLKAAGLYATAPYAEYEIRLIRDFKNEESLTKEGELLAFGRMDVPGYYTVEFNYPQALESGERYALIVYLDTPGNERPVAVELKRESYADAVTLEGRETYLSKDGSDWENTQTVYRTNVCLKAYTSDMPASDSPGNYSKTNESLVNDSHANYSKTNDSPASDSPARDSQA